MALKNILRRAKEVLAIEKEAIENVALNLDSTFTNVVDAVHGSRGKVVITGMGKAGIVGRKIAATLASTGTPAVPLHPAEAVHGDMGIVAEQDIVIAISNSGETEEVLRIVPIIKRIGAVLVAMTGNMESSLAKESDFVLNVSVVLAVGTRPMALGDALALALLDMRGFKKSDFAKFHPAGTIGSVLKETLQNTPRTRRRKQP